MAFVKLTRESPAVLLEVNMDFGTVENGVTPLIAIRCACDTVSVSI